MSSPTKSPFPWSNLSSLCVTTSRRTRSSEVSRRSLKQRLKTCFNLKPRLNRSVYGLGQRPFGVSFLYAGWDEHHRFQLYHSDPSGNFSGWKATAIGANNEPAKRLLKNE